MSTRDQILASAWKLFSERGFEDVSVRDVTNDAGVNLASVSYHFGSKDGLIQEVVKRVLNPASERRIEQLDRVIAEQGGEENVTLKQVLECYVRPSLFPEEHGGNLGILSRLIARYLIERDYDAPNSVVVLFGEVFKKYVTIISLKAPHLTKDEILRRLLFSIGSGLYYQSFSCLVNKVTGKGDVEVDREGDFQELVNFLLAGFQH